MNKIRSRFTSITGRLISVNDSANAGVSGGFSPGYMFAWGRNQTNSWLDLRRTRVSAQLGLFQPGRTKNPGGVNASDTRKRESAGALRFGKKRKTSDWIGLFTKKNRGHWPPVFFGSSDIRATSSLHVPNATARLRRKVEKGNGSRFFLPTPLSYVSWVTTGYRSRRLIFCINALWNK